MHILISVLKDFIQFFNPKTKKGAVKLVIAILIILIGVYFMQNSTADEPVVGIIFY
jgi:hypothetical protein